MTLSNLNLTDKKQQKKLLNTLKSINGVNDAYFDGGVLTVCCAPEKEYCILAAIKADGFNFEL